MDPGTKLTPHQQIHATIRDTEEQLRDSFERDLRADLEVTDSATSCLATVVSSVGQRSGTIAIDKNGIPTGEDAHILQLFALVLMGARAVRVIRAARAVLACGYEAESRANDRILVELLEHRRAILADPTGAQAKAWMEGTSGRGIGRRVAEQAPQDMYTNLSMDSHGDPRPLARLLDPATGTMYLQPIRTTATRASLLMHAGFAYDQTVAVSTFAGLEVDGLDQLNAAVKASWKRLEADAEAAR
jgi:hypothetical protein